MIAKRYVIAGSFIVLCAYLSFLAYNFYWQPVKVIVPAGFRGTLRITFSAHTFFLPLGYKKTFVFERPETLNCNRSSPYEYWAQTIPYNDQGVRLEIGDIEQVKMDSVERFYIIGILDDEVWYSVGTSDDLVKSQKAYFGHRLRMATQ